MPSLIFDLDGTLVDTAPDLIATLNKVLGDGGFDAVPEATARPFIGFGARHMLERGLEYQNIALSKPEIDRLHEAFLKYYAENIAVHSRPFDGLVASLERHRQAGFLFGVCTNKLERLSVRLLEELQLTHWFEAVCGADTFAVKKPHQDHLLGTIKAAGAEAETAIMIGDSETDIRAAQNAGVPVIAVDFGYTPAPVETFSPTGIISHYDELDDAVADILG